MSEALTAAWDKVAEDWDDQARHDALLQLAVQSNELKWVAAKYRDKKGDAIADRQLVKLTNAALATMLATAKAKADSDVPAPYKRAALWLIVMLAMLIAGLFAVKLLASVHHTPSR